MGPLTRAIFDEFERLSAEFEDRAESFFSGSGPAAPSVASPPQPELASLIRAAAAVEQAFGGLNAQLWDDPYEWTLPEAMGSKSLVLDYLAEVDSERRKGFDRIKSDDDLSKDLWTPWGTMTIAELLNRTLSRARMLEAKGAARDYRA